MGIIIVIKYLLIKTTKKVGLSYSFTLVFSCSIFFPLLTTVDGGKSINKIPYLTNFCCLQSKIHLCKSLHAVKGGTNACPQLQRENCHKPLSLECASAVFSLPQ